MISIRLASGLACCLVASNLVSTLAAQDRNEAERAAINLLLNDYWESGTKSNKSANSTFQKAREMAVQTESIKWAFVVNQINHGRYREAYEVVADIAGDPDTRWDVAYTEIWLALITQKTDQSLTAMQKLVSNIDADPNIDAQVRGMTARRLGRLYGYAENASKVLPHPMLLGETLDKIKSVFEPNEMIVFEDHRQLVTDDFLDLSQQMTVALQQQTDQALANQKQEIQQLDNENQQMDQIRNDLEQQIVEIRNAAEKELEDLRSQAQPLESDLRRVQSDMRSVQSDLFAVQQEIIAAELAAIHEPDPIICSRLYRRIRRLSSEARAYEADLAALSATYQDIAGQLSILYVSRDQLIANTNNQMQSAQSELALINRTENKNNRQISRLQKPRVKTGLRRSLENQLHHLPTYDPFPAESFRKAILDSLT